jgi:hypothetical protein
MSCPKARFAEKILLPQIVAGLVAVTMLSATAFAFATPSPNGPGQPGAPQTTCGSPDTTQTPPSVTAKGSPFNSSGTSGTVYAGNPGTASLAHAASPNAVSQYDIACFQLTQH